MRTVLHHDGDRRSGGAGGRLRRARGAGRRACSTEPASRRSGGGSSAPSTRAIERQSYELSVPVPARALDRRARCAEIAAAFHDRHRADLRPRQPRRAGAARQRARLGRPSARRSILVARQAGAGGTDASKPRSARCGSASTGTGAGRRSTTRGACRPGLAAPGPADDRVAPESTILVAAGLAGSRWTTTASCC